MVNGLNKQHHGDLGNTILITGRDQAKMDRAKSGLSKIHTFRTRDFPYPESIATLYEEVNQTISELNILNQHAGIMREINVRRKAGKPRRLTRRDEINFERAIRSS